MSARTPRPAWGPWSMIVMAGLLVAAGHLVSGCSRRAGEGTEAGSGADTLGNGLPRLLVPKLASWEHVWRHAIPGFAADSLTRGSATPFRFDYAWAGRAGRATESIRTRALVEVLSPDSARSLDFDMYLDFDRDADGSIVLQREPDSAPVLADFESDTLWRVSFCGTPCFYDGAYWVDAERFVLTGAMQTGAQADGPWCAFLEIYDLRSRGLRTWLAPAVDARQFARYQAASESALEERLERAGFGRPADSTAGSRAELVLP